MRVKTVATKDKLASAKAAKKKQEKSRVAEEENPEPMEQVITPNKRKWEGVGEISSSCNNTRSAKVAKVATTGPTQTDQRFKIMNYKRLYNKVFGARKIASGRAVDFNSLDDVSAGFVRLWFQYQRWDKLLEESDDVYPELVRQFYTHFNHANLEQGVIHTWVKGKSIVLDDTELGKILNIPTTGLHNLPGNKWSTVNGFDPTEAIRLVLSDPDAEGTNKPSINEPPMPSRLLHLNLMQTFICRLGRKSSLTYLDMLVMYCVLAKKKMNMPMMMINYMVAAHNSKKKGFLPYGMWLTKVFRHFKVDLSNEVIADYEYTTPFNSNTITVALGYTFDPTLRVWKKRGVRRASKRATPYVKAPAKDPEKDGRLGVTEELVQNAVLESLVVLEMLRRLHPEVFTTSLMNDIRVVATKAMAKHFETGDDNGNNLDAEEGDEGACTRRTDRDDVDDEDDVSGDDDTEHDEDDVRFDPEDD